MTITIDEMASFCKKKGFVYPHAEIYGGLSGFFDYGHLGVELKNNIKQELWKTFVQQRKDIVGIDGSLVNHAKIWQASGHTEHFSDILLECRKCHAKAKVEQLLEETLKVKTEGMSAEELIKLAIEQQVKCPKCKGDLEAARTFNLMFETNVGPGEGNIAYLRPETAQVIFTNFRLVQEHARMKLPFGIAQCGKAYRNEISPRDFLFRCREFEQFEIEFFSHPDKADDCPLFGTIAQQKVHVLFADGKEADVTFNDLFAKKTGNKWHLYWLSQFHEFFLRFGIKPEHLRVRQHATSELAHYAKACFDLEYLFPFGWKEIHGNADRIGLEPQIKLSGKDLSYFDQETNERVVPRVASEPSQGIERALLAFLFDAYDDDKQRGNIVLKLHAKLAPVKAGIFPLINKPELISVAKDIQTALQRHVLVQYDQSGSVGRRYARADEIGVPYCITVDFDSLKDNAVTIRDRNTTEQKRVAIDTLPMTVANLINGIVSFSSL